MLGLILAAPPKEKANEHEELIDSKATLIVCSGAIIGQWDNEISRATPGLRKLLLRSIDDFKNVTYEEMRSAYDVVICNHEVLSNARYLSLPSKRASQASFFKPDREKKVKKALEELRAKRNFDVVKYPILEHFSFHRVVFDVYYSIDFEDIQGRSNWFVSGSPFTIERPLYHMLKILRFTEPPNCHNCFDAYQEELVCTKYLWRNTRDSVKHEFAVPEPVEEFQFIEFSVIERAIYFLDSMYDKKASILACCSYPYTRGLGKALEDRVIQLTVRSNLNFTVDYNFINNTHF